MASKRFARLSNGFSKRLDCHLAAVALHVAYYNLCRVHEIFAQHASYGAWASPIAFGRLATFWMPPWRRAAVPDAYRAGSAAAVPRN